MRGMPFDREPTPAASPRSMRLLGLYAHPDDETFCSGGTFARYAAAGADVRVVSLTRGQAGQIRDAGVATRRTLGDVREKELQGACQRLGVRSCRCLDHEDGGLAETDASVLVAELLQEIRGFRPTSVFTFGPDGGYGHPDHVALCAAVTEAFDVAGAASIPRSHGAARLLPQAPVSLYYAYFPRHRRRLLDRMVRWLDDRDERFRGDVGFVTALLHIAEEARDLGAIADHLETRWFPAGTSIIEQGEPPAALYLILSGEAEAVREQPDGSIEVLGVLEAGQFFGETGIARSQPRNAHVIARSPLTCLQFSPAEPARFAGRGEGARLGETIASGNDGEELGAATIRIDVSGVIEKKMAAIAAYRSQFAFAVDLIPTALLVDLFGVEYFVRARPAHAPEHGIS